MNDVFFHKFNELRANVETIKTICDRTNIILDGIISEIAWIKKENEPTNEKIKLLEEKINI